jgi:transposase InsO family protein
VIDLPDTIAELNRLLQDWEGVYNTIRPHQALGYLTPLAFLQQLDTSHLIGKEKVYGR